MPTALSTPAGPSRTFRKLFPPLATAPQRAPPCSSETRKMQLLARRSVVRSAARPASRPALAPRPLQGRQQQCSVLVRANPIKLSEKDLREQIDKPLKRAAQKRAMSMYNSESLTLAAALLLAAVGLGGGFWVALLRGTLRLERAVAQGRGTGRRESIAGCSATFFSLPDE